MENPTLSDPNKLLFLRQRLDEKDVKHMTYSLCAPGFASLRLTNVSVLLLLLNAARDWDQKRFMIDLFLPWVSIQRGLEVSRNRLADEFIRVGDFKEESTDELVHLVQIYRLIVADVWDPYITLPFACYQFLDNSFTDIVTANLGQGERNKAEYVKPRLKTLDPDLRLLSGYDPIVRNAVSHSGSHGVTYEQDGVVFRAIKRGQVPKVKMVRWSRDSLFESVALLYEFILSVDVAVNTFGLDCQALFQDWETYAAFVQHALTPEERQRFHSKKNSTLAAIRKSAHMSEGEKLEGLSPVLFLECGKRELPITRVLASKEGMLLLDLPAIAEQPLADSTLESSIQTFCRYAILAESIFGEMFPRYAVHAQTDSGELNVVLIANSFTSTAKKRQA